MVKLNFMPPKYRIVLHLFTSRSGIIKEYYVIQKRWFLFFYFDTPVLYKHNNQWFLRDRFYYYPQGILDCLLKHQNDNRSIIIKDYEQLH